LKQDFGQEFVTYQPAKHLVKSC